MAVEVLDDNYLALTAIITVGLQFIGYLIAFFLQVDKLTDFLGSMNYVLNVLLTLFLGNNLIARQLYLTFFVVAARLYLGFYLLYRVVKRGHDARFDGFRDKPLSFLGFWVFQMIWVYCNTLNVVLVNSSQKDIDLEALDYVGMAIMVIGLGYEVIGDQQKQAWKNSEASKGAVLCDVGLWGHTRHPNYFGEMFFWIGAFISSLPVVTREDDYFYIAVLSPIITILILLFLGGLPTAEGSSLKKYYKDEESKQTWLAYKQRTSILFPFPPALYAALPLWFKRVFCLELPMYEYDPGDTEEPLSPNANSSANKEDSNSDTPSKQYGATAGSDSK